MPCESVAPATDDTVKVVEEKVSTSAELPTPRPWRPRGVRAGRRHKKRCGVSLIIVQCNGWDELLQQKDSQRLATLAAETQA